jgi:hypothetical protein
VSPAGLAAALSDRAESLRDGWLEILGSPDSPVRMDGELEVVEQPDGSLHMVMSKVVLRDPASAEQDPDAVVLELGTLSAFLRPVGERRWATVWEIPGEMKLRDGRGHALGVLRIDERTFSGVWAEDLKTLLTADLSLVGLSFTLDEEAVRTAHDERDGARNGERLPHGIQAGRLSFSLDLAESEPGVVSGPMVLALDRVLLEDEAGTPVGGLGSLHVEVRYHDVDLPAISALADLAAAPEAGVHEHPGALLSELLAALGGFETTTEIIDLSAGEVDGSGGFRLGAARLTSGFMPSADDARERDFWIDVQGRDWRFADDAGAHELEAFGADLRLERIAPETLLQGGQLSMVADELPADQLVGLSREVLGSLVLGLSFRGISGRIGIDDPAATRYGLDRLDFGLRLLDLDSYAPGVALSYRQHGLSAVAEGLLPVPAEFLPHAVVLDLEASRLPTGQLLEDGGELNLDPGDVLGAMLENRTRLDIREILIDLPIAGLRMNGHVRVDEAETGAPGVLRSRAELEIRNLDTLIEHALASGATEEMRQQVMGVAMILKLAAEKRSGPNGEVIHYLLVEASSLGELLINGTDLAPLLMGGGR